MSSMRSRSTTRPNSVKPSPLLRLLGVDAENPVPIRIEGQRQAVREHVRLQRLQIGLCRLRRRELQTRQPPGGVVDEHDGRAARSPALQPIVRAPVDLNELAEARPAFANLENLLDASSLGPPEPQPDLADRLSRHRDALDLAKLLARSGAATLGRWPHKQVGPGQLRQPRPELFR